MVEWKIVSLIHQVSDGLVTNAHWWAQEVVNGQIYSVDGYQQFTGSSSDPNFIPYENLTEQIVVGWIHVILGEEGLLEIEQKIQSMYQPAPVVYSTGIPWG